MVPRSAIGPGDSQWSEIEHATFLKGYVQPAKCPSKWRLGCYGGATCRITRWVNFHGYWLTARPPKFSWNGFYSAYRASKPTVYCVAWRVVWRLYSFNLPERRVAEPEPERSPGTGAEACPQSRSRSNFPGSAALISHIWKPTNSVDVFYDILIDKAFSGLLSDDGPLGSGAPRRSGPLPPWWNPGYATAHRKGLLMFVMFVMAYNACEGIFRIKTNHSPFIGTIWQCYTAIKDTLKNGLSKVYQNLWRALYINVWFSMILHINPRLTGVFP